MPREIPWRQTLKARLGGVTLAALVLTLLVIAANLYLISSLQGDAAGINLLGKGRYLSYQALALCWRNGQRSPIHNHRGSACGVKVLRGVATETVFVRAPNGMVVPTGSRELAAGFICGSFDEDIHQVSNLQANDGDLVTLHIYSPPLLRMDMFSLDTPAVHEWDDPVDDPFELGAGI